MRYPYACLIESQMVLTDNVTPFVFIPDERKAEIKICLTYNEQGQSTYLAFLYQYFTFILFQGTFTYLVNEVYCKWSLPFN